ncbi:MAG: S8 family serine peptidase [Pirellulales bacterium]
MSASRVLQGIPGDDIDGNSHMTRFVDWSAREHDVLYVIAWGNNDSPIKRAPTDNFNGMTIAASQQVDPMNGDDQFRMFGSINNLFGRPTDDREPISLLAPGQPVAALGLNNMITFDAQGTSAAAPHVTGTVALLQQFAQPKVDAGTDPGWGANSQRHETMKAVMMNSADKLAGVHGSTRTVVDNVGDSWLQSPAHISNMVSLDPLIGAGHLNARRSLLQYESGEVDPGMVPSIAWDYHTVGDMTEYIFDSEIGGGYIAATLAWDRRVEKTTGGNYMEGDQFVNEAAEDRLNNLDLYLMPANSNDFMDAISSSISPVMNVEHIFFNIASPGQYKLVVHNNPVGGIGDNQAYALAWWFGNPSPPGDYNGNGSVGPEDYDLWRSNFGSTSNLAADGNGNDVIDAADYTVWRDHLGAGAGSGTAAEVPEPSSMILALIAILAVKFRGESLKLF